MTSKPNATRHDHCHHAVRVVESEKEHPKCLPLSAGEGRDLGGTGE